MREPTLAVPEIPETLAASFRPEARSAGQRLFAQEKVSISSGSDTAAQALVRVAPPARVRLQAADAGAPGLTAECSCPKGRQGTLCKHIWAALLAVGGRYPDLLIGKTSIDPTSASAEAAPSVKASQAAAKQAAYKESQKARAAEYRKTQYERQKERLRALKGGGKPGRADSAKLAPALPAEARAALLYFAENGFPMDDGPSEEVLVEARRKLSRVFHPDRGGTHEEMAELNRNCELLERLT